MRFPAAASSLQHVPRNSEISLPLHKCRAVKENENKNIAAAIENWPTTVLSREMGGVYGGSECSNRISDAKIHIVSHSNYWCIFVFCLVIEI